MMMNLLKMRANDYLLTCTNQSASKSNADSVFLRPLLSKSGGPLLFTHKNIDSRHSYILRVSIY